MSTSPLSRIARPLAGAAGASVVATRLPAIVFTGWTAPSLAARGLPAPESGAAGGTRRRQTPDGCPSGVISCVETGPPGGIRTPDLLIRSPYQSPHEYQIRSYIPS
jgi:hypothetical protein